MITFLFITYFVITILFTLKDFRYGFFMFLFAYFGYPYIMAMGVGDAGFAITMPRALLIAFTVGIGIRLIESPKNRIFLREQIPAFFKWAALLYIWKVICTVLNVGLVKGLSGLLIDFLICFTLFATVLLAVKYAKDLLTILYILALTIILNEFVVGWELLLGESPFASIDYTFSSQRNYTQNTLRNELIRTQGIFLHPLILAYTLILCFPLLFALVYKIRFNIFIFLISVFVPFTIFFTRSRSSIALFGVVLLLVLLGANFNNLRRSFNQQKMIIATTFFVLLAVTVLFAKPVFVYLDQFAGGGGIDLAEDNSGFHRLAQFYVFSELSMNTLLTGFGRVRYLLELIDTTEALDNFYIRTGLEAGIPGLFLLITYQLSSLFFGFKLLQKVWTDVFYRILVGNILLSMTILILILNLSSSDFFSFFLFGLPALLVVINRLYSEEYQLLVAQHSTSTKI